MPSASTAITDPAAHDTLTYLAELDAEKNDTKKTELLFAWLCDDSHRPALYAELRQHRPVLRIASCAPPSATGAPAPRFVYLITDTPTIHAALSTFSNSVYRGIGTGTFVLGMDLTPEHATKRGFLIEALKTDPRHVHTMAIFACHHSLVGPLKVENFDFVSDIAEQAAVRFIAAYFGFPDSDHVLLQESLRRGFDGMILQMFARHFTTELAIPTAGKMAMGGLTDRIAALLREASPMPLRNQIFSWLQKNSHGATQTLESLATHLATADPKINTTVEKYLAEIAAPGLAERTADFFDFVLNFGRVRRAIPAELAKVPDELQEGLAVIVNDLIAKKTSPDEHLVPRRWLSDGSLPEFDDKNGDYVFRTTVIEKLARNPGSNTSLATAVDVIGLIAGLIGNVVAGASTAINQYFQLDAATMFDVVGRAKPFIATKPESIKDAIESARLLEPFIKESMRLQPPAAFLPRTTLQDGQLKLNAQDLPAGTEVIVPLGAPTRDFEDSDRFDEAHGQHALADYILGDPDTGLNSHRCIGGYVAQPIVAHIVRSVLALPGLARQQLHGKPAKLEKKWGYICESFPLRYERDQCIVQRPLNVVMNIKAPVAEHAEKLKLVIKYGAPAVEQLLQRSRIVHFARFVFLNGDTQLALLTEYDGDFAAYIRYFALVAGPLFDAIFEHIEEPPVMPVRDNPTEFVKHIARFDKASAGNYFYSAHPTRKVV